MAKIAVIVRSHNHAAELDAGLLCLAQQTMTASDWQLVVVDEASTDDTRAVVKRHAATLDLTLVVLDPRRPRTSPAWQVGLECADAPVLLFLDPSVLPAPNLVRAHLRHVTRLRAVSVGRASAADRATGLLGRRGWSGGGDEGNDVDPDSLGRAAARAWTHNMALPRDLLVRASVGLGGRDGSAWEDAELIGRLRAVGARFMINAAAAGLLASGAETGSGSY